MPTIFSTDQIVAAMRDFETSINKHMESPYPSLYSPEFAQMMREWVKELTWTLKSGHGCAEARLKALSSAHPDEFCEFFEGVFNKLGLNTGPDLKDDDVNGFWMALK